MYDREELIQSMIPDTEGTHYRYAGKEVPDTIWQNILPIFKYPGATANDTNINTFFLVASSLRVLQRVFRQHVPCQAQIKGRVKLAVWVSQYVFIVMLKKEFPHIHTGSSGS